MIFQIIEFASYMFIFFVAFVACFVVHLIYDEVQKKKKSHEFLMNEIKIYIEGINENEIKIKELESIIENFKIYIYESRGKYTRIMLECDNNQDSFRYAQNAHFIFDEIFHKLGQK